MSAPPSAAGNPVSYNGVTPLRSVGSCRWIDAGKFLTGFSAVGSIAIPAILYHAQVCGRQRAVPLLQLKQGAARNILLPVQKITPGALGFELAAVAVLGGTVLAYDYYSSRETSYGYY